VNTSWLKIDYTKALEERSKLAIKGDGKKGY